MMMRITILTLTAFATILIGAGASGAEDGQIRDHDLIFGFMDDEPAWSIINDTVMGGVSSSRINAKDGIAVFEGEVSLDNNGGFASTRSEEIEHDLEGATAVHLRVRGDGKKYQFRIRTTGAWDGPSYRMEFETKKGEWIDVLLPIDDFVPVYRGRVIPDYPALDAKKITTMGFLIADKQEGAFRLEIDWIKKVTEETK